MLRKIYSDALGHRRLLLRRRPERATRRTSSDPSAAQRNILTPSARAGTFTFNTTCTAATCPAGVTPGQQRSVNILQFAQSAGLAGIPSTIDPVVQARLLAGMPEQGNRSDIGDQLNTTG